ncbi:MAG: thrombospondin type 3 repeat-containing protein, partial [Ginsengibacter sp.]
MNPQNVTKLVFSKLIFLIFLLFSTASLYAQNDAGNVSTSKYTVREDADQDGIKNRKDKCPETAKGVSVDAKGCPLDTDKDGIVDYLDKCPDVPGSADMNGCQDKDKDGVADNDDICQDIPGLARFKGCPDSDDDGIEDSKDKCPNTKGP